MRVRTRAHTQEVGEIECVAHRGQIKSPQTARLKGEVREGGSAFASRIA